MSALAQIVNAIALPAACGVYAAESPVLRWSDQGALLAEFARSRGLGQQAWLQAAGLQSAPDLLSPRQLMTLLAPLVRLGRDAPFVLGQLWLPGHYGLSSQALLQSAHSLQAAERLSAWAGRLLPLAQPRLLVDGERLWLLMGTACGLPAALRPAIVDLHLSAFSSLCNWRAGERLPWRFHFNRTAPGDLGTHAVLLGEQLQFDCQIDALSLPLSVARLAWPRDGAQRGADLAATALAEGADAQALRRGWLAEVQERMLAQLVDGAVAQEALAQQLGISLATLKRQFAAHGTHWQAELDQLRAQAALALLRLRGLRAPEVAEVLGFVDASNFRRSLRRWTGLNPESLATA